MEPLGKMNAYFPIVNEHISKRNKKATLLSLVIHGRLLIFRQLLDYDSARSRLNKLIAKPSEDPTKLPKVCISLSMHMYRVSIFNYHNRLNKNTMTRRKYSTCSTSN